LEEAGVRFNATRNGYILLAGGDGSVVIELITNSSATTLKQCFNSGGYTVTQHDTFRLTIIGTTLTGTLNGLEVNGSGNCDVTDSTIASGTPALLEYSTGTMSSDAQVEAWDAGANQQAAPIFSTYTPGFTGNVTMTCPVTCSGGIYYTTNGSQPTRSSTNVASGSMVAVTGGTTLLRAMAAGTNVADSNPVAVQY
jgi:hypothetical protein